MLIGDKVSSMTEVKRARLTRDSIIATALSLVEEVGLDDLTTRRLAAELEVRSPALYWHFASKRELLDGMGDAIILRAGMGPPLVDESWQEWITRRARAYRHEMLTQRDGARIVSAVRVASPDTVKAFAQEVSAMAGFGFDPVFAMRSIAIVTHYVTGFVLKEQAASVAQSSDGGAGVDLSDVLSGAELETFAQAIGAGGDPIGEDVFEHGLSMIISGTALALDRHHNSRD